MERQTTLSRLHSAWFDEGWRVSIVTKITEYGIKIIDFYMIDTDQTFGASFTEIANLTIGQTVYLRRGPNRQALRCNFMDFDTLQQTALTGRLLKAKS